MGRQELTLVDVAFWRVALPKEEEPCCSHWYFRGPISIHFSIPLRLGAIAPSIPVTCNNNGHFQGNPSSFVKSLKDKLTQPSTCQSQEQVLKEGGVHSSQVHFCSVTGSLSLLGHFTPLQQVPEVFQCCVSLNTHLQWTGLGWDPFSHMPSHSMEWFYVSYLQRCM